MITTKKSVSVSIFVCITVAVILGILVFLGPKVFEFYMTAYRGFVPDGEALRMLKKTFAFCFYPSAVFSAVILYSLLSLLFNIKKGDTFTRINVLLLKIVSWCCFAIGIITFVGGFFYMPFMFVAAAGGFLGMFLRVLKNVMQSAVEIAEENELTI